MTLAARAILALLLALVVVRPALPAQATPTTPVSGGVTFTAEPMTTVERTEIVVTVTSPPGAVIDPWIDNYNAALTEAGWTIVRTDTSAPALAAGDAIATEVAFIAEPFLDGDYVVPDLTITGRTADGEPFTTTLVGGSVRVESVLPPDERDADPLGIGAGETALESGELADAPLGTLAPPPAVPEPGLGPVTIALIVLGLLAIAALVRTALVTARRARQPRQKDPVRRLARLARLDAPDASALDEAHACLAEAVRRSDAHVVARNADLAELLGRFERARYAPTEPSPTERSRLIADAARSARSLPADSERGAHA